MRDNDNQIAEKLPWVPKELFLDQNRETVAEILGTIAVDSENSAFAEEARRAQNDVESGGELSEETRRFMWRRWMGTQHGTAEGTQGKVLITQDNSKRYWELIKQLHYGDLRFTEGRYTPSDIEIGHSLILGSGPEEIIARMQAAYGDDPASGRIHNAHLLVGQRRRWPGAPDELNPETIISTVSRQIGNEHFDMDELLGMPHWRDEIKKPVDPEFNNWDEAFATEYIIGKLALEAMLYDLIDWKNGSEDIPATSTDQPAQELIDAGVPLRDSVMTIYHLKNGTNATLLNAAAIPRHNGGNPRPTCESQYREIIDSGVFSKNSADLELPMSVSVSTPHWRAVIEAPMRLLGNNNPTLNRIPSILPVGHDWSPTKDPITALGEIIATHKADLRLRALMDGKNPDAPELLDI